MLTLPNERRFPLTHILEIAAAIASVVLLACSCSQPLPTTDAARPSAQDAGSDVGALSFVYCNKDLPQNQTKFVAIMVSPSADGGDGGPCEIAYEISFGAVTFSCSCGPVADCQKIGASLAAEAAACLGVDAGLEAGR